MKHVLLLSALFVSQASFGNAMNQIEGRTLDCGGKILRFSSNAEGIMINGRRGTIQWGNGGIDAVINNDNDLEWQSPRSWTLDGVRCKFVD